MAEITASLVKELRERSGAGMMECKKALPRTTATSTPPMEWLRKSGLAKADKKASRVAAEGRIVMAQDGGKAVLVEINSETDFVAKDENFLDVRRCRRADRAESGAARRRGAEGRQDVVRRRPSRKAAPWLIAKVGENVQVRRMATHGQRQHDRRLRPWRPHRRAGRGQGWRRRAGHAASRCTSPR